VYGVAGLPLGTTVELEVIFEVGLENPDARTHAARRPSWTKTLLAIR
jgi:hypothetical protein